MWPYLLNILFKTPCLMLLAVALVALTSSAQARAAAACTYLRASLDLRVTLPKECRWGCKAMISRVFAWHFLNGKMKLSWQEFHRKVGRARTAYHWQVHHLNKDPTHTLGNRLSIMTHSRHQRLSHSCRQRQQNICMCASCAIDPSCADAGPQRGLPHICACTLSRVCCACVRVRMRVRVRVRVGVRVRVRMRVRVM